MACFPFKGVSNKKNLLDKAKYGSLAYYPLNDNFTTFFCENKRKHLLIF